MNNYKLKQTAKERLRGKYGDAILVLIIFFAIGSIGTGIGKTIFPSNQVSEGITVSFGSSVGSMIATVLTSLFVLGYYSYFLKIARGETTNFQELFSKTSLFIPALVINIISGLLTAIGLMILIVPGIIISIMLSQAYYIALEDEKLSPIDCLKKSKEMMEGHKMEYFKLVLPFYLLMILSVLLLFIPLLYIIPNLQTTTALYYDELKKKSA